MMRHKLALDMLENGIYKLNLEISALALRETYTQDERAKCIKQLHDLEYSKRLLEESL